MIFHPSLTIFNWNSYPASIQESTVLGSTSFSPTDFPSSNGSKEVYHHPPRRQNEINLSINLRFEAMMIGVQHGTTYFRQIWVNHNISLT